MISVLCRSDVPKKKPPLLRTVREGELPEICVIIKVKTSTFISNIFVIIYSISFLFLLWTYIDDKRSVDEIDIH